MEDIHAFQTEGSDTSIKNSALREIGVKLREAREKKHISIDDLSESLKLGKEQVIAIENGDLEALPENVFIKAIIKRISEKTDIDSAPLIEKIKEVSTNSKSLIEDTQRASFFSGKKISITIAIILSTFLLYLSNIYVERSKSNKNINSQSENPIKVIND